MKDGITVHFVNDSAAVELENLHVVVRLDEDGVPTVYVDSSEMAEEHTTPRHAIPKIRIQLNEEVLHSPEIAETEDPG